VVFELMAALGVSQRSAANRLAFAASLAGLPALGQAARDGAFDVPTVLIVLDKVDALPAHLRADAVHRLLAAHHALPGGLTRPQLTRLLGRIVAALDPHDAEDRQPTPPGTGGLAPTRTRRRGPGHLGHDRPGERVALCRDSIDALARAITGHPDTPTGLTLDQARFDALAWLPRLTEHPRRRRAGRPHTTGPPGRAHPDHDTHHHRTAPAG
jgi:hypothetical protein